MKPLSLILLIILAAVLQVTFFYGFTASVVFNLILALVWILFLTDSEEDAVIFGLSAGLLVDLLSLDGLGTTSFSILLPLLIFSAAKRVFGLENTLGSFVVSLLMMILTGVIAYIIEIVQGRGRVFEAALLQPIILSAMISWIFSVVVTLVNSWIGQSASSVSLIPKRK